MICECCKQPASSHICYFCSTIVRNANILKKNSKKIFDKISDTYVEDPQDKRLPKLALTYEEFKKIIDNI